MNRPLFAGLGLAALSLTLLLAETVAHRVLSDAAAMGLYGESGGPGEAPARDGDASADPT